MQITKQRHKTNQYGLTLVEIMISLTIGLFLILLITGVVIQSKSTQAAQIDLSVMQDTARLALDNISRNIKQAGYTNYDKADTPFIVSDEMSPNVIGFDAKSVAAKTANISQLVASNNNSSDIIALRFFGSGQPADNTVLNCAGFAEAEPTNRADVSAGRAWSIYYVALDVGEPALFCKYRGNNEGNFQAYAIARGVESFQVLYGINRSSPGNSITEQFLTATEITALDTGISTAELNKKTHWKKITAIKVALLIRGNSNSRADNETTHHHLFGQAYSNANAGKDAGSTIDEAKLSKSNQKRLRKIYSTTIQLNNSGKI